ncbi:MAG TPA: hypothetical protein VL992_14800 [Tepidisphaeraceae bacterium]|nr:hypothetical protein [Tepidisphaeraceae bacterium]
MGTLAHNRLSSNALIIAAAILLLGLALSAFLDQRNDLIDLRAIKFHQLDQAQATLQQEAELKQFMAGAGAVQTADSTSVERRFLHLVRQWEQQTGVSNPSFQRVAAASEHGFTRLTYQISASGSLGAVAGLLYRAETSPIPLRIDSALVRPARDQSGNVVIQMSVSALCRGRGQPSPGAPASPAEGAL